MDRKFTMSSDFVLLEMVFYNKHLTQELKLLLKKNKKGQLGEMLIIYVDDD